MTRDEKIDRVQTLAFHLGKALWKSIPVVGPFVDELVYEQFKDGLLPQVRKGAGRLDDASLDRLLATLPSQDQLASVEERLAQLDWEQRLQAAHNYAGVMKNLAEGFRGVDAGFSRLEGLLAEMGDAVASDEQMKEKLSNLERRRLAWTGRISQSQLDVLQLVPHMPTPIMALWASAKASILPQSSELEFRFRLHELEWLELVSRRRSADGNQGWLYWRNVEGRPSP